MITPRTLIITTAGINCDLELAEASRLAGATTESIHLNRLMAEPELIDGFQLIGLPGGFSYGDAIAAGRIAAQLMRETLYPAFVRAIERRVPIIAPCNGFQIAVQMGLLPGPAPDATWPPAPAPAVVTLAENDSARFIDRWVGVEYPESRCIWTRDLRGPDSVRLLPIAHAEGRFIPDSDERLATLERNGQVAVRYRAADNPNGSVGHVAGLCDASGLVLGLMPHPERYTRWTAHPTWTRLTDVERDGTPPGLAMFRNAVEHARRVAGSSASTDDSRNGEMAAVTS